MELLTQEAEDTFHTAPDSLNRLEFNSTMYFQFNTQWTGNPPSHPDVMSWKDLVSLGQDMSEELLVERQKKMAINHCATLVYTSGTTGMPKGN